MTRSSSPANKRQADYPVDQMFVDRWSPRAFTRQPILEADLLTMLEAARWAASSYNSQPWRFLYSRRDTPSWEQFLNLLVPANQAWAKDASAIVVFVSKETMTKPGSTDEIPSPTHSFDTGTASGYFALQAFRMGWFAHGMVGFDHERTLQELKVPSGYSAEAVYAVGRLGDPSQLPEALQQREFPNDRHPLTKLAFEGLFRDGA